MSRYTRMEHPLSGSRDPVPAELSRRRVLGWLALSPLLGGCQSLSPGIGIEELYGGSARREEQDRNPIIVIPGITGSRIRDPQSGEIVWGVLGGVRGGRRRWQIALPMKKGIPLPALRDGLVADEVLDRVQVHAGVPISVKAYAQLLAALGAGGYRDQTLGESGAIDYGELHFTCFQFPYDWRRPCAENATALATFIEEKRRYVAAERRRRYGSSGPVKFDLVAHSMGGLVVRHYLMYGGRSAGDPTSSRPGDGAEGIGTIVLVGTPNGGAVVAFKQLIEGYRPAPLMESFHPAVVGSLPSLYELLPRPRHAPVQDRHGNPVDHMDPEVWIREGWGLASSRIDRALEHLMPEVANPASRREIARDHLAKCLASARELHDSLDRPAHPSISRKIHLFIGDRISTPSRATVDERGSVVIVETDTGDGTVTRASALLDERIGRSASRLKSSLEWAQTTLIDANHLDLTRDPNFIDNLLHLLLET